MFRRPRFSVRPNVGTAGKAPSEAPSATTEAGETPKDDGESSAAAAAATDNQSVTPPDKPAASGDGNEQNAEGAGSSAAVQRRKRFSIKPKVAPGRPSTAAARRQKSPVKAVSETPVGVPGVSDIDGPTASGQTGTAAAGPQRLQSPRRRGSSEDGKQPRATLGSEPSADSNLPAESGKESESTSAKGAPSRPPDKVPLSLPDREAIEISEKARTLVSAKSRLSISPPAFSLSRLLNDPSDLQRIAKAQKLRDLLRQEMHKEKKLKKGNTRVQEYTLDPAKMTMRDLIRYLPQSNPMTSSLEEPAPENETVVAPSPAREVSPEKAQEPLVLPKIGSPREVEEEEGEGPGEEEDEEDDGSLVPQVKVAEDGTLIIDEESLTVEVLRAKGPNLAQERDPIFERGSTTTYSSFRKGTYTKPWSSEETDMFFLAISMVGTDFSMICQLFPLRTRSEIKNKFKKEERENSWRVDKAFRERRKLDIEYFTKLLEKIMEVHKNRKKLKSLAAKNSPRKTTRKAKGKKAARKLSVVEEEDEKEERGIADLEEEGEKENEDLRNEGGADASKPKKKRKRKSREEEEEGPDDKKNKAGEKSSERGEVCVPGDTEAALPEDCSTSDISEKTEVVNEAADAKIKPAKLSRGRAPKPLLPLGRKWGKKPPPVSTETSTTTASDKEDESVIDAEDQVSKDASPVRQAEGKKSASDDSEEEETAVRPPRPTRSGRVPKPVQLLNYPAKEAASAASPASPEGSASSAARPNKAKSTAKRGRPSKPQSSQESKKPKLVTLRASQSEYSDEEDEKRRDEEEEEDVEEDEGPVRGSSLDGTAPVFVPASLRSPRPVISEVEETMEELDILANIPDVLGITQNEMGTAESCEHQLDLLVDVIDFLSSDPAEVSEHESYNEAAQTLLTIGNMGHLPSSAQNQVAIPDHATGTTSANVKETSRHLEEEIAAKPAVLEETGDVPSDHGAIETTETVPVVEPLNSTTDNDDVSVMESIDQRIDFEMDPAPPLQGPESSKTNSPQTRKGRSSKAKPKPNLGRASRTAQSKLQPETSTARRAEKSHTVAPDLAQTTETLSAAGESPEIADCSKNMLKEDISSIEVKRAEEPSGSRTRSAGEVQSDAATSDQSASENQRRRFPEAQLEPGVDQAAGDSRSTSGSTEEVLTAERSCDNRATSDSAVAESEGSNMDSAQESGDHLAPCVAPVEELPVSQKEGSEVESTQPTRKSRFQKVKPKVNLAPTSRTRSKPQTTKDTEEEDSHPTPPNPKIHEKTIAEVEAEPTCTKSPKKTSRCPDPASDLIPLVNLGTTLTPTEELSTTEEEKADAGVVGRVESDAATSHHSVSEKQNIPEAQFTPRREQATRDTTPTLESLDEKVTSHFGAAESSCDDPRLTSDPVVTESQTGQGSNMDSAQESGDHLAPCVAPVEELPVNQKEGSEVESTQPTRKSRFQKVKPNLVPTSKTSDPVVTESQTGRGSKNMDSALVQESGDHLVPHAEELPVGQKEEDDVASTFQSPRRRIQKVKPKPNLPQTSRTARSKPPTTEDCAAPLQHAETTPSSQTSGSESTDDTRAVAEARPACGATPPEKASRIKSTGAASVSEPHGELCSTHKTAEESPSCEEQKTDVGLDSNSQNVPQRRQRFARVKPNLGSPKTPRTTHSKLQENDISKPPEQGHVDTSSSSEPEPVDNNAAQTEQDLTGTDLTSTLCSPRTEPFSPTRPVPAESEAAQDSSPSSLAIEMYWGAENWSQYTDLDLENITGNNHPVEEGESLGDKTANSDHGEAGPASQCDRNRDMSVRATESNTRPADDPIAASDVQSSEGGSTKSAAESILPTSTQSTAGSKESTRQPPAEDECAAQSPGAVQQCSDTDQTAAQSSDGNPSEPTDSPSRKAPQARRSRLVKPKPRLVRSGRPPQPRQLQNAKQAETDVGACSVGVDAELRPDTPDPTEGAIAQCRTQNSSPNDAGSSLVCLTLVPDSCPRDASTSNAGGTQSLPIFPDMLSQQEASDPDEQFFILSLTEIPDGSLSEPVGGAPELFPYLPVTDASIEQQSVPVEAPLPYLPVSASVEESGEAAACATQPCWIVENPAEPHGSSPSKSPETLEDKDETEIPSKQAGGAAVTRRRVKEPLKPKTSKRKQASNTLVAEETGSIPIPIRTDAAAAGPSELPGSSLQPEGSGDGVDVDQETQTAPVPEDGSSRPRAARTRATRSQRRKPKGFLSVVPETSDAPPPGEAAPEGPTVRAPRAAGKGKRSTAAAPPAASTSRGGAPPARRATRPAVTNAPPCPAERSVSVASSSREEEPTSVSQYFLCDIFTDVEG